MAAIDDIVQITISRQTQTVSRRAFGFALIIGVHAKFGDRLIWVDQADWSDTLVAYGFAATDDIYNAVSRYFAQSPCPTRGAVGRIGAGETIAVALAAAKQADAGWYGLILCSKTTQDVKDAMTWTESNKRLFLWSSWDPNIVDQTLTADLSSLAFWCKANAYKRSGGLFTRGSLYPEAAWTGRCFPKDPGTINWAHKVLADVAVDGLTATQRKNAHDKFCSTYETIGGVNVTEEGWTGSGDFFDITQACDWLEATLQEEIFSKLANLDKLPFDDGGIKVIEGVIRGVLKKATDNGVLAEYDPDQGDYYDFPRAADISQADKIARTLDLTKCFQRRLSGALNHVKVQGNITI